MSDIELAPDNTAAELSASATPTPTPKATPKGKGRGRGRKAVAKKVVVPASVAPPISATTAPRKAAGGRRGRTKQFDDDHIQSKYERQREIKSCYSELAQILKPALIELADRQIESMKKDANYHKQWPEYTVVTTELQGIADLRKEQADANYTLAIEAEHHRHRVSLEINDQVYHNNFSEAEDGFLDGVIRRLDILENLYDRGLPADEPDTSYNFKAISNEDADNLGPYEVYHEGRIVPYPHRLEGTAAYERNRAMWAQPSAAAAETTTTKQTTKGQMRRRAKDQPDAQASSKRNALNGANDSFSSTIAPAKHVQSMMSAQPTVLEPEEPSNESTPVPEGNLPPRGREPVLPTHASDPDAYGVRTVNKPMPKGDPEKSGPSNRFIIPNFMNLEPHEIGFRDSTNERTRGATVAKRGKYYETNDSATLHLDPMVARHHAGLLTEDDFDEELVERHQVHPRYGFFLPRSRNDAEPPKEVVSGDSPTVFLTPDGRTIHASRTIQRHRTEEANLDAERQRAMKASLGQFCIDNGITAEEIDTPEMQDLRAIKAAMDEKRLEDFKSKVATATATPENETTDAATGGKYPSDHDGLFAILGVISAMEDAPPASTDAAAPTSAPVVATPARSITRSYDAIRDMVVEHAATEPARPAENTTGLEVLANLTLAGGRSKPYDNLHGPGESSVRRHMSLGLIHDQDESASLPAIDPALQPFAAPIDSSALRSTLSSARETLPPMEGLAARSDKLQGIVPPRPLENGSIYPGHRERSGSFLDPSRRSLLHQDYAPARPVEMMSVRDPDHRAYHAESYPSPYGGTQRPSYHAPSRPAPSSRVPFSNPLSLASPALPPLRPTQAYGEPSNGYFGQGSGRLSVDSSYMHTMQPTPIHPGGGYHSLASGPSPSSQFGSHTLGSPFHTIAPSPSQMHSPPLLPFGHQYGSVLDLGGPPRGKPGSASSTPNAKQIYRELAPAPLPPHRQGQNQAQELRTINYIPGDNIKDYTPTEQLPARGPQMVRSWNQYSHKNKLGMGQDRRDSS